MRVSKEQAAQNRQKRLNAAARLFRDRGMSVAGVDAITEAAGLTYGAVLRPIRIQGSHRGRGQARDFP